MFNIKIPLFDMQKIINLMVTCVMFVVFVCCLCSCGASKKISSSVKSSSSESVSVDGLQKDSVHVSLNQSQVKEWFSQWASSVRDTFFQTNVEQIHEIITTKVDSLGRESRTEDRTTIRNVATQSAHNESSVAEFYSRSLDVLSKRIDSLKVALYAATSYNRKDSVSSHYEKQTEKSTNAYVLYFALVCILLPCGIVYYWYRNR